MITGLAYFIVRMPFLTESISNHSIIHSILIAYGGAEMNPTRSQITRYLSASVLLNTDIRNRVIEFVEQERKALIPELGIDLEKLAHLSYLLKAREQRYQVIFLVITIAIFLLSIFFMIEPLLAIVLFALVAWVVYFYKKYEQRYKLIPLVTKNNYDPLQLEQVLEAQYSAKNLPRSIPNSDQNLVVYSGFTPFVGIGFSLGGWSFSVNVNRPKEEMGQLLEIKPFKLQDLYNSVERVIGLCKFEGYVAKDFLFVNGQQIRDQRWILPSIFSHPVHRVNDELVEKYLVNNDPLVRYYKCIRVFDWSNEIVISYFIRFSIRGGHLFIEVNRFLLTPLAQRHRQIDTILPPTGSTLIELAMTSLLAGPFVAIFGVLSVLWRMYSAFEEMDLFGGQRRHRQREKEMRRNVLFNYGAITSLRQQLGSSVYDHYFQKLDKEMYIKVIDKQIIEAITDFLEKHNIDISDIKERKTTILNSGIIVQGGEIKAQALAVGSESKASSHNNNT